MSIEVLDSSSNKQNPLTENNGEMVLGRTVQEVEDMLLNSQRRNSDLFQKYFKTRDPAYRRSDIVVEYCKRFLSNADEFKKICDLLEKVSPEQVIPILHQLLEKVCTAPYCKNSMQVILAHETYFRSYNIEVVPTILGHIESIKKNDFLALCEQRLLNPDNMSSWMDNNFTLSFATDKNMKDIFDQIATKKQKSLDEVISEYIRNLLEQGFILDNANLLSYYEFINEHSRNIGSDICELLLEHYRPKFPADDTQVKIFFMISGLQPQKNFTVPDRILRLMIHTLEVNKSGDKQKTYIDRLTKQIDTSTSLSWEKLLQETEDRDNNKKLHLIEVFLTLGVADWGIIKDYVEKILENKPTIKQKYALFNLLDGWIGKNAGLTEVREYLASFLFQVFNTQVMYKTLYIELHTIARASDNLGKMLRFFQAARIYNSEAVTFRLQYNLRNCNEDLYLEQIFSNYVALEGEKSLLDFIDTYADDRKVMMNLLYVPLKIYDKSLQTSTFKERIESVIQSLCESGGEDGVKQANTWLLKYPDQESKDTLYTIVYKAYLEGGFSCTENDVKKYCNFLKVSDVEQHRYMILFYIQQGERDSLQSYCIKNDYELPGELKKLYETTKQDREQEKNRIGQEKKIHATHLYAGYLRYPEKYRVDISYDENSMHLTQFVENQKYIFCQDNDDTIHLVSSENPAHANIFANKSRITTLEGQSKTDIGTTYTNSAGRIVFGGGHMSIDRITKVITLFGSSGTYGPIDDDYDLLLISLLKQWSKDQFSEEYAIVVERDEDDD